MTVATAFMVLAVELDTGTLFLAGRGGALGSDVLTPAVLSFGAASKDGAALTLEAQALPDYVYPSAYWTNRAAMLLEVDPGAGSVYDGRPVFDGVIAAEPSEQVGVLSLDLIPYRARVVQLPGYGVIDAAAYPSAPASSQGAHKPLIFGTVEDCPLIPVTLPASTVLSVAADAGDAQLEVADATLIAASGSVVVDGHTYAYSAKSGNILLGVAVDGDHRAGTMVAQAGSAVFLAAGHALAALSNIKSAGTLLQGATIDLPAATVTYTTLPSVAVSGERRNVSLQFDAVGTGNTALNPTNAIRYAAVQASANAIALPGIIHANSDPLTSIITFARPAERIVRGIYTVAFTVSIGAQVGWARVKIGGDVVWQMEAPASVIYNYSPATILLDTDVDVLPVVVEVEQGGSVDQVSVTVTSASRVVYTGNLDDANYATLRQPSNNLFRADQLTANPGLGRITRAQLVVRWFALKAGMGVPTVKFGGRTLGVLAQTQLNDAALAQNITVDVIAQGVASLPQQNINTVVSKTDNVVSAQINSAVSYTPAWSSGGYTGCHPLDIELALPPGVAAGTYVITLQINKQADGNGYQQSVFRVGNLSQTINQLTPPATLTFNAVLAENQSTLRIRNSIGGSDLPYPYDSAVGQFAPSIKYVSGTVNVRPTAAALSVSGSSSPLSAQNLGHSGTTVGVSGGNINFTVPAPPRVVNTVFDLAEYTDWTQFTNKQVEISYAAGTGVDLCVVQVYLAVEYDAITYTAAGSSAAPLTATVTGLSGNPADVLAWLVQSSGSKQRVDVAAKTRLSAWCAANNYAFARRIADPVDALQLLTFAAEQCGAELCDTPDGMVFARWLDLAEMPTAIDPSDLLDAARIGWADRIENSITLNYRADYSGNLSALRTGGSPGAFSRALVADAASDINCRRGLSAVANETRAVTLDGGWIRADATAARYLADYARRYARPRRTLSLALPFAYSALLHGSLIEYDSITARITALDDDNGWLDISAEEVFV